MCSQSQRWLPQQQTASSLSRLKNQRSFASETRFFQLLALRFDPFPWAKSPGGNQGSASHGIHPIPGTLLTQGCFLPGRAGHGIGDVGLGPPRGGRADAVGTHVLKNEPVPDLQLGQGQAVGQAVICMAKGAPEAAAVGGVVRAGSLQGNDGVSIGNEGFPEPQGPGSSPPTPGAHEALLVHPGSVSPGAPALCYGAQGHRGGLGSMPPTTRDPLGCPQPGWILTLGS